MAATPTGGLRGTRPYPAMWKDKPGGNPSLNEILNRIDQWGASIGIPAGLIDDVNDLKTKVLELQGLTTEILNEVKTGWYKADETWSFVSFNTQTRTAVFDVLAASSKYTPGMRVRFQQGTGIRYGIVTNATPSTLTVYVGWLHTVINAPILDPVFSTEKAPLGFPTNPHFWTIFSAYPSTFNETNPTSGTPYNIGGISITVPPGGWNLGFYTYVNVEPQNAPINRILTVYLSPDIAFPSDPDLVAMKFGHPEVTGYFTRERNVQINTTTTFYLVCRINSTVATTTMSILGAFNRTLLRAVSNFV